MDTSQTQLSHEELLAGKIGGVWTLKQPLQGYKKIRCRCTNSAGSFNVPAIAHLTIPTGAVVVRGGHMLNPSEKLRSDTQKIDKIESLHKKDKIDKNDCAPYLFRESTPTYQEGCQYTGKLEISEKICAPGYHFFLTKEEAEQFKI